MMKSGRETVEALQALPGAEAARIVGELGEAAVAHLYGDWPAWVHAGQEVPESEDWRVCLMFGGRGFGKTRAGAEWISKLARDHPGARIALVAANLGEARRVMVEGPAGLIAVARPGEALLWEPSRRRLEFQSGAVASLYSGANGDSLRGPEHHFAWCDELAKWAQARGILEQSDAWAEGRRAPARAGDDDPAADRRSEGDHRRRRYRSGRRTERGQPARRSALARGDGARAWRHPARPAGARRRADRGSGRGALGEGDDRGTKVWTGDGYRRRNGDSHFCAGPRPAGEGPGKTVLERTLVRIVVGVDPPASVEGVCGIVVCGTDESGMGYVLADLSASGLSPEGWARKVAAAAEAWGAERVVAEANNGGAMVEAVLTGANVGVPVTLVHAAEGKVARAAPVGTLFESGRAWFAGRFPALEDELAGLTWDGRYRARGARPTGRTRWSGR